MSAAATNAVLHVLAKLLRTQFSGEPAVVYSQMHP